MTVDQTTFLDQSCLRKIPHLSNSVYDVYVDDTGLGMVFHRLKKPGRGMLRNYRCVTHGETTLARFINRTDLPVGARMYATDVGGWFRWNGTIWTVETPFTLVASMGSVATPLVVMTNEHTGFNGFGPGIPTPAGLMQIGRRFRWSSTVGRQTGSLTTGHTQVLIGTSVIFDAPWQATPREQYPFFEFWVSGANKITTKGLAVPNGATDTPWTTDVTVPNLQTAAQTLIIGINNTSGSNQTEKFNLGDVLVECMD